MSRGKGKRTLQLVNAAAEILEAIQPASVRAVCYQLFQIYRLIPNMGKSATNTISRVLRDAREEGRIPWEWIVDATRQGEIAPQWSNPEHFIRDTVRQYRRSYWQDQGYRVEVWSEKSTVRGTLWPVLSEYGVEFQPMHGFASTTIAHDKAELAKLSIKIDKPLVALYVGDWDPSGKSMSDRDLPQRLKKYGGRVTLKRIALVRKDLRSLPSFDVETKRKDPNYRWFKKNVGRQCCELDAMRPPDLRARVKAEILRYIDMPRWEHAKMIEAAEVESLRAYSKSWQASICSRPEP